MKEDESEKKAAAEKAENPLQRLMIESTADELALRLKEPVRLSRIDLSELIARGVSVLSMMAAELGVSLRVRMRREKIFSTADEDKIRRVVNATAVHLLSVSRSDGWVMIGLEEKSWNGRKGSLLQLTACNVVMSWKEDPPLEKESDSPSELVLCREIVEQQGGQYTVEWQNDGKLTYSVWLPA